MIMMGYIFFFFEIAYRCQNLNTNCVVMQCTKTKKEKNDVDSISGRRDKGECASTCAQKLEHVQPLTNMKLYRQR